MRLVASDFVTHYRPTKCELRVFLRHRGEPEAEPSPFDEVLHRLGLRHEKQHLATLGPHTDLSGLSEDERIQQTQDAIARKVPVLYQPAFRVHHQIAGTEVEIVGQPDFLILDGDGYLIRDSKISRRIDEEQPPRNPASGAAIRMAVMKRVAARLLKALQVHSGTGEIVPVLYDGGVAALAGLERLLAVKQSSDEFYEPVGWSKCNGCGFKERCWARAVANGDVALVPDIDQNLARTLHTAGTRTRRDLLANFDAASLGQFKRPFGNREQRVGKRSERILQFAEAMETQTERVLAVPAIPQVPNHVMFDLEGMPPQLDELDKIYLWGMQVFGEKPSDFTHSVSGFGPDGDRAGWMVFLEKANGIFEAYGDIPFVHWATYEKTYLRRYVDRYGDVDGVAARVEANLLDLLRVTQDSIVLPLPSYSLKVVEQYIGFERKQSEFGGQWAMATFIEATETSDEQERQKLMAQIIAYNKKTSRRRGRYLSG